MSRNLEVTEPFATQQNDAEDGNGRPEPGPRITSLGNFLPRRIPSFFGGSAQSKRRRGRARHVPNEAKPQKTPSLLPVEGRLWGISKAQIRDFVAECRAREELDAEDDIRVFVERCVKPRTKGTGMGLSLLLNQRRPLEATVMISHAWDEHAGRFFEDIDAHVGEGEVLFICFFAICQNEDGAGPSISEQLGEDISGGPFASVIKNLRPGYYSPPRGRVLVVTNAEVALYTRMWCIWEVYNARRNSVPIDYTGRGSLFASGDASSRQARCGHPDAPLNGDERAIRGQIEGLPLLSLAEQVLTAIATVVLAVFFFGLLVYCKSPWYYWFLLWSGVAAFPVIVIRIYMRCGGRHRGDGYDRIDTIVRDAVSEP